VLLQQAGRVVRGGPGGREPGAACSARPAAPPPGVVSAVMIIPVPARAVTSRPPGRSAASQLAGTGATDVTGTIRS
jgi:hypothetical protein